MEKESNINNSPITNNDWQVMLMLRAGLNVMKKNPARYAHVIKDDLKLLHEKYYKKALM